MRGVVASVLAVGLVGCSFHFGPGRGLPGDPPGGGPRVLHIPELGAGIYHCQGPGAAKSGQNFNFPTCDEIPVIVLDAGSGECVAFLPYNALWVHVGRNRPKTDVTWVILGPKGYKFDSGSGGLSFKAPGDVWVDGHEGQGDHDKAKFRWSVKEGADIYSAYHQAFVVSPSGVKCAPIDPKAVNTDQ